MATGGYYDENGEYIPPEYPSEAPDPWPEEDSAPDTVVGGSDGPPDIPDHGDEYVPPGAPAQSAPASGGGLTYNRATDGDPFTWAQRVAAGMPPTYDSLQKIIAALRAGGASVSQPTNASGLSRDKLVIDGQMYDFIRDVDGPGAAWMFGKVDAGGGGGGAGTSAGPTDSAPPFTFPDVLSSGHMSTPNPTAQAAVSDLMALVNTIPESFYEAPAPFQYPEFIAPSWDMPGLVFGDTRESTPSPLMTADPRMSSRPAPSQTFREQQSPDEPGEDPFRSKFHTRRGTPSQPLSQETPSQTPSQTGPDGLGTIQFPGEFTFEEFQTPAPFGFEEFQAPAPFGFEEFQAPGGFTYPAWAEPTGEQVRAMDPGYDFRLKEAQRAVEHAASARGTLKSGATLDALMNRAQGLAAQEYGAGRERLFQGWQANRGTAAEDHDRRWRDTLTDYTTRYGTAADVYDRNLRTEFAGYATRRGTAAEDYDRNVRNQFADYGVRRDAAVSDYDRLWRDKLTQYGLLHGQESDEYNRALQAYDTNFRTATTRHGFDLDAAASMAGGRQGATSLAGNLLLGTGQLVLSDRNSMFQSLLDLYNISTRNLPTYTPSYLSSYGFGDM